MKYLLDVNVLVAWGWRDHAEHERAATWIGLAKRQPEWLLLTASIPQLGFVRVSVQRSGSQISVQEAEATLKNMLGALGEHHSFLTDDCPANGFPSWCQNASRTTDAHLLQLAKTHKAQLATLDTGIPGAFLIPSLGSLKRGIVQSGTEG